ncbi:unnamed protein product [Rotaria socialis]|uniref:Uncharacterized protein n=1 Tax=Rotaria socialis TaxID=392032 RepID=A0A821L5X8_9BILA|nr:unnamed protein product [Rotaria socialis]
MSTTDMKCNLTVLNLIEHDILHNGTTCNICQQPIGKHIYQHEIVNEIKNVKYEYDEPILEEKNESLSLSPNSEGSSNVGPRSQSTKSGGRESMKSSASSEAKDRIPSAPLSQDSETVKKNIAIINKQKNTAMVAASTERFILCTGFIRKYHCSHTGSNNVEELYNRILSMINKDTNRVYHLMKHARHSCFGLVQITMNDDQLMDLFKFLNNYLPPIFEENI